MGGRAILSGTTHTTDATRKTGDAPAGPERQVRFARLPATLFVGTGSLLVVLTGTVQMFRPLDRDEGAFLVIAQEILHGHVPYRDVFDHKSPGIYVLLAVILLLTSHLSIFSQIVAMRLVVALVNLATAAGLIAFGKRWWRLEVGALAAATWLVALPLYEGVSAFTEPFAMAATMWALVLASGKPGFRSALKSGLLLALGSLFKQTAVLALPGTVYLLYTCLLPAQGWRPPLRSLLTATAAFVAGLTAPWLVVISLFGLAGAEQPLIQQVVVANLRYPPAPADITQQMVSYAVTQFPLVWLAAPVVVIASAAVYFRGVRCKDAHVRLNPGLVAAALAGTLNWTPIVSHAFLHYFVQVLPWAALLCASGLVALLDLWRPHARPVDASWVDATLRALLLPVTLGLVLAFSLSDSLPASADMNTASAGLRSQIQAGEWIRARTRPNARVLVLPAEPELYYLSGKQPVTHDVYILAVNRTDALMATLNRQVADGRFDAIVWQTAPGAPDFGPGWAATYAILKQRYQAVSSYPQLGLILYTLKPSAG